MSRAEYMRDYRAKQKTAPTTDGPAVADLLDRIDELQGEVARLKRELAARPAGRPTIEVMPSDDPSMRGYGQYRPAPKR